MNFGLNSLAAQQSASLDDRDQRLDGNSVADRGVEGPGFEIPYFLVEQEAFPFGIEMELPPGFQSLGHGVFHIERPSAVRGQGNAAQESHQGTQNGGENRLFQKRII
ncbi:hypothetical protein SDC9_05423 [bioreactor metagenome]|uniref:Uncharacterized protein n=1 Tax=bioreactor metagenome TaxID=1076179 RepID=A0A644T091_9ZZZZ